jgi:hypothetical protein
MKTEPDSEALQKKQCLYNITCGFGSCYTAKQQTLGNMH